ncbi:hypothetical protein EPUL_003993 [Erysiphe pulchra]|uniref:ATP-dependent DNA helicase n=1 Tax=Erysiphe pulchra TaxID=225359 RepID=A0A2S4PL54_9PEZI|nr:hypothetical protein EPUL_003993 [Erysiphe pulchra]
MHRVAFNQNLTAEQVTIAAQSQTSPFIDWMKYNAENEDGRDLLYVFDDSDWVSLFEEVKDSSSASSLRQTFAAAIMHSAIISPQDLWDRFKIPFTDDCLWRMRTLGDRVDAPPSSWTEEECRFDFGLWLLEENLGHLGLDWQTARITGPRHRWIVREENALIVEAMDVDRESEAAMHSSVLTILSTGQRTAYDTIVSSIERGLGDSVFFLQGAAGTGKKILYKTLCGLYKSQSKIVLCVASSEIAALLLPNGRTAHSVFRIPLDCLGNAVCNIGGQNHLADLLRQTSLIIWVEVTMQQKNDFAAVDKSLRDIKKKVDAMFGGIPVSGNDNEGQKSDAIGFHKSMDNTEKKKNCLTALFCKPFIRRKQTKLPTHDIILMIDSMEISQEPQAPSTDTSNQSPPIPTVPSTHNPPSPFASSSPLSEIQLSNKITVGRPILKPIAPSKRLTSGRIPQNCSESTEMENAFLPKELAEVIATRQRRERAWHVRVMICTTVLSNIDSTLENLVEDIELEEAEAFKAYLRLAISNFAAAESSHSLPSIPMHTWPYKGNGNGNRNGKETDKNLAKKVAIATPRIILSQATMRGMNKKAKLL